MDSKTRLPLYTFLAVFIAITLVQSAFLPLILHYFRSGYFDLQLDLTKRQVDQSARFLLHRLDQGISKAQVLEEFQASIQGSQYDRGYVCIVDQKALDYLCHPNAEVVGLRIAETKGMFAENPQEIDQSDILWKDYIAEGRSGGGLLRHLADDNKSEVVYFQSIDELGWTVSSHINTTRLEQELNRFQELIIAAIFFISIILALAASFAARRASLGYEHQIEEKNRLLAVEQEKSEQLLLNILPASIAERMKKGEQLIADYFQNVTVIFCDISGFTELSAKTHPQDLVKILNQIFSEFDQISERYHVEKIKTIGDAYMAVCGIPLSLQKPLMPNHATQIAKMALEMLQAMEKLPFNLSVRIGIHSGPVVAGVIGKQKFNYDLWGDTVNTAARMESHGLVNQIHISEDTYQLLKHQFICLERGQIPVKGKGVMTTYFLQSCL